MIAMGAAGITCGGGPVFRFVVVIACVLMRVLTSVRTARFRSSYACLWQGLRCPLLCAVHLALVRDNAICWRNAAFGFAIEHRGAAGAEA